jgi:hypothetical protein
MNLAHLNPFRHKATDVGIPRGLALSLAFTLAGLFAVQLGWGIYMLYTLSQFLGNGDAIQSSYYLMSTLYSLAPPVACFLISYAFHPKTHNSRRRVFISLLIAFVATVIAGMLTTLALAIGTSSHGQGQGSGSSLAVSGMFTALTTIVPILLFAALLMYLRQSNRWK